MDTLCPVLELRQYTLRPGRRDELIELFERELIEPQEAVGARIVGTFRDADAADRFVWLRGFRDMDARRRALEAFYGGPVWRAHRDAANATMIDSDNVLLLRPVRPTSGFAPGARAATVVATIYYLAAAPDEAVLGAFERHVARPLALFHTEPAENTFPRLPVRTGENVLVAFAAGAAEPAPPALAAHYARAPETLRLTPTARSPLR
jgi:hypothetical protein